MKTKKTFLASLLCLLMVVFSIVGFAGCVKGLYCEHQWGSWSVTTKATCTDDGVQERKCELCDEKETETIAALGTTHTWEDATCTAPKTCTTCETTEGAALGHTWVDATCAAPKTCSVCQTTDGVALEHAWENATCTLPKTCSACQTTEGVALGHDWVDATCTEPKTCETCQATEGSALGHDWVDATCTEPKTCERCQATEGSALGHDWTDATCTEPKTCERCQATEGSALGHDWVDATCTEPKTCETCQATEGVANGHTPEEDWAKDENNHWHECANCEGQEFEKAEHAYDDACDTTCDTCGYQRTITHSYTKLNGDANEHWYECDVCNAIDPESVEAHEGGTATCGAKANCEVCNVAYGELDGTNHTSEEFKYVTNNDGTHAKKYACCGAVAVALEDCLGTEATCTKKAVCQYCNVAYGDLKDHVGGNASCENQAICEVCGNAYGTLGQHVFSVEDAKDVYIATPASCTDAATYYKTCACGTVGTETFVSGVALGHDYGEWTYANDSHTKVCKNDSTHVETYACEGGAATCEEPAICATCNHEYGVALGHSYGEWTETVAPTCTTIGKKTATCTNGDCTVSKSEDIPANGHSYTDVVTDPTCTTKGYTTHTCACGDVVVDSYVEPIEHNWNIPAPTCTEKQICGDCNATEDALDHDYQVHTTEATCTEAATTTYTCKRTECKHTYTDTIGSPKEHDIAGVTPTLAAVDGELCKFVQHYACNACGGDVVGETVFHHDKYTATIVTAATCTTEGQKKLTCSTCGYEKPETEVIPVDDVTGHIWVEGDTVGGVTSYTCKHNAAHTKTAISVGEEDTVNAQDIKNTELQLSGGASVTLGDAGDFIGNDDVTVSVNTVDKSSVNLSAEQLAQVGKSEIYDFSIQNAAGPIDFKDNTGLMTVTLKYELKEGDNIDNIAVWYIADDGTLKAYEATYNEVDGQGYVTFKTDHFSYYTVTELTPKQRCALYGHNFSTKDVAPTCTDAGYTLSFCIRCGHSEKKIGAPAIGHSYVADEKNSTAATCTTAGKTKYVCSTCKHAYTVVVPAMRHSWKESERVEATCMQAGRVVYTCQNEGCGDEYVKPLAQLSHEMSATIIPATCTEIGYTLHECTNENCTYSYNDTIVQPVGHEYAYDFVWSEDYTAVALVVTCAHEGCDFTESVEIGKISIKDIPADCFNYGRYEYTVRGTYNGEIFEDKKHKDHEDQSYKHFYGNGWKHDHDKHWHECDLCGGRDDEHFVDHVFGEGIVTKKATCSEMGIVSYACACGYIKTEILPVTGEHQYIANDLKYDGESHWNVCAICDVRCNVTEHDFVESVLVEATCATSGEKAAQCSVCHYTELATIPATNLHTYEGGVCTSCGRAEGTCTHEELVEKVLDLSEYGMCISELDILTCECGEVVQLKDYEQLVEGCYWDESDENYDEGVDENGNPYMSATMYCSVCDAEMYVYATMQMPESCYMLITYEFTITVGGEVVLDKIIGIDEGYEHDSTTSERVDLSEYSSCGGYYYAAKCDVCGEIDYVYDVNFGCELDESTATTEEVTDEKGNVHTVMTATCPDCGLVFVFDEYEVVRSICESVYYYTETVYCGDEIIYQKEDEDWEESHEWETEYEMFGETCEDGYRVISHCDKCGFTESYTTEGHRTTWTEIKLADHGACGGYITGSVCRICGVMTSVSDFRPECSGMGEPTTETTVDENGVEHTVQTVTCADCGLTIVSDVWVEETECLTTMHGVGTISVNGEVLVTMTEKQVQEDRHQYVETYEPRGDDCEEDGYVVTRTCTVCGETERFGTSGHREEEVTVDLAEYGACGGTLTYANCKICNKILGVGDFMPECEIDVETEPPVQEVVDENGVTHYIQAVVCPTCGLTITSETWEIVDGCTTSEYMVGIVSVGETTIIRFEDSYAYTDHEYVYSYEMLGETCDDGVKIGRTCTKCGESHSEGTAYGHQYNHQNVELSKYSACGGYAYAYVCRVCNRINPYYDFDMQIQCNIEEMPEATEVTDENGNVHYVRSMACPDCGLIFTEEAWEEVDSVCVSREYMRMIIATADETLLDWYMCDESINHQYETVVEMNGESCNDGFTIIHQCTLCGDASTEDYKGCYYQRTYYDLTELGVPCGGRVEISKCIGCGKVGDVYENYYCRLAFVETTEDGYTVYACKNCGATSIYKETATEKDENCAYTKTHYRAFYFNETLVLEYSYDRYYTEHEYAETLTLEGDSCLDGVIVLRTCQDCGYNYTERYQYHYTTEVYNVSSEETDFCEHHYFSVSACPCGAESNVNCSDYYGANVDYACESCSFRVVILMEETVDGCHYTHTRTSALYSGEVQLYQNVYVQENDQHDMKVSGTKAADGTLSLTAVCSVCGLTTEYVTEAGTEVELVYNEDFGGYCYDLVFTPENGGEYTIYSMTDGDTCVTLYRVDNNGKYLEIDYNDDGRENNNFYLTHYLEAGNTYVYRIRFLDKNRSGSISYVFKGGDSAGEGNGCEHWTDMHHVLPEGVTSCEDGLLELHVCYRCGEIVNVYEINKHYTVGTYYSFSEYGACYGEVMMDSCPCGQVGYGKFYEGCYTDYTEETTVDANGVEHWIQSYTCSNCGKLLVVDRYTAKEGCAVINYVQLDLFINGESRLSVAITEGRDYEHTYEYDFTFDNVEGELNCEDGVTVTTWCTSCNASYTDYMTWHNVYAQEAIDLSEYDICGGEITMGSCPCGKETNLNISHEGYLEPLEGDDYVDVDGVYHDVSGYLCRDCNFAYVNDRYSERVGCERITYSRYYVAIFDMESGEVKSPILEDYVSVMREEAHNYEYVYVFDDAEGEPNCENGVTVTKICNDCGDSNEYGHYDGHSTFTTTYNTVDFGGCGGYINVYECPCGYSARVSFHHDGYMPSTEESYEDETGNIHTVRTYVCEDCALTRVRDTYSVKEGCYRNYYATESVSIGDTIILSDYTYKSSQSSEHDYEITYDFTNGVEDCEAGVDHIYTCKDCDYSYTNNYTWHYTLTKERYDDLSEYGACGGSFRYYECACGESSGVNYNFYCYTHVTSDSYIDEDGILYTTYARACDTCNLRCQDVYYTVRDADTCKEITYHQITLNVGGELVTTLNYAATVDSHEYVPTAVLNEGATSCEDGVTVTYTCYCGASYSEYHVGHVRLESERYDLTAAEYGASNHMGYAVVKICPCGQESDIDFADTMCEFGTVWTSCWVEGYVEGYVYTAEYMSSGVYLGSDTRVQTCAVTDPQCAYKLRRSTYYLPVAGQCVAEEWETWQLGYNAEENTWAYEISVKTGNIQTYHAYVETRIDESYENGITKEWGTRYDCPDCGSYYYYVDYYNEDGSHAGYDNVYENKLDDGMRKKYENHVEYDENGNTKLQKYTYTNADDTVTWEQWEYVKNNAYTYTLGGEVCSGYEQKSIYTNSDGRRESSEYAYVYYKGYSYNIYSYNEQTDGYWYRYDYTYNFDGTCEMTTVYTDSYGANETSTGTCHHTYWKVEVSSTCTQDGVESYRCYVCESVLQENIPTSPSGHWWNYDYDKQLYVCSHCGLENINGADGDIVFEDLTEQYGNGENYVAGYWKRNEVQFIYTVSLMLHTPLADGNDQIILEGVTVIELDDVRAVSFSKAEVATFAEAKAAELGITLTPDAYDVRLSFVPVGADEIHDYAITFTDGEGDSEEGGEVTPEIPDLEIVNPLELNVATVVSEGVEYTFTAEVDGEYVFTPSGENIAWVEVYTKEAWENWGAPFVVNQTGEFNTLKLSAGESVVIIPTNGGEGDFFLTVTLQGESVEGEWKAFY